jgi:hypothetical protein
MRFNPNRRRLELRLFEELKMRLVCETETEIGTDVPSAVMAELARRDLQQLFRHHLASWASDAMAADRRHAAETRSQHVHQADHLGQLDHVEFDDLLDHLDVDLEIEAMLGHGPDGAADEGSEDTARPVRRRAA